MAYLYIKVGGMVNVSVLHLYISAGGYFKLQNLTGAVTTATMGLSRDLQSYVIITFG